MKDLVSVSLRREILTATEKTTLLIGTNPPNGGIGRAFVFFGGVTGTKNADTDADIILVGQDTKRNFGWDVSSAGNFNNDGADDIIIGTWASQSAYIFFGRTDLLVDIAGSSPPLMIDNPDTNADVFFNSGHSLQSVASAGDFNGDGIDDVVIGDPQVFGNRGGTYIFFGFESALDGAGNIIPVTRSINDADVTVYGNDRNDNLGVSVASAGDFNGDGKDDIIAGAPSLGRATGSVTGAAYIIFGGATGSIFHPNTCADVFLKGVSPQWALGTSVASAGDFSGDGKSDVIIGGRGSSSAFVFSGFVPPGSVNADVSANAGLDQTVDEGTSVTLNGSGSFQCKSLPLNYDWEQVAGPAVTLDDPASATPTFTAPNVSSNQTLTFALIVDDGTHFSDPDTVDIVVVSANTPPVAIAGNDSTVKPGAVATLDGTASYDDDGDSITHTWTQVDGEPVILDLAVPAQPTFTAPDKVGDVLVFKLEVSDGQVSSIPSAGADSSFADTVAVTIVENSAPVADAGPDQTRDEGAQVTLDGSGSSDPDGGDVISFQWTQIGGPAVTLTSGDTSGPSFTAPVVGAGGADLTFQLTVTDNDPVNPKSGTDTVVIHVANINDPPNCDAATASLDLGWPPTHKMVPVEILNVVDPQNNSVTITVTGITQDEPVSGLSNGDSSPDGVIQPNDPADSVLLRLERDAQANGRVYVVSFTASDGFESCNGSITVNVPHSRKSGAVDDGQNHDSTLP